MWPLSSRDGTITAYGFWCPGCKEYHSFDVTPGRGWRFNGDIDKPTFSPSLLYPSKPIRCHLFLRNGMLQFCGDCGHELAGKTVPLPVDPGHAEPDSQTPTEGE